jgi:hypothetical protein
MIVSFQIEILRGVYGRFVVSNKYSNESHLQGPEKLDRLGGDCHISRRLYTGPTYHTDIVTHYTCCKEIASYVT